MKGEIELGEFIRSTKRELIEAAQQKDTEVPFFTLNEIELMTEFSVSTKAAGGVKLVVSVDGAVEASQKHAVTLKFKPIPQFINPWLPPKKFGVPIGGEAATAGRMMASETSDEVAKAIEATTRSGINFHGDFPAIIIVPGDST